MRAIFLFGLIFFSLVSVVNSQDRFRTPIETSSLSVRIEDFATIPDARNRVPARASLLTKDPTGRLFINDQAGPMYTIDSAGTNVTEFLDLRDFSELRLISSSEEGFQSFAFHPGFADEASDGFGRFYTIHSSSNTAPTPDYNPGGRAALHTLLLEWQTSSPTDPVFTAVNPDQPYREVLRVQQPYSNHNSGLIAFNYTADQADTDFGNLYVAFGDGGSADDPQDNGQDRSNPLGAILRIDPRGNNSANGQYGIVPDNVLAADNDALTLGEIFASGLRNPQRFGWDTQTGNMFIADIGQDSVEEINLGVNGGNFGWDDREGSFRFDSDNTEGLIDPVAEYDHTRTVSDPPTGIGNRAVTVGDVARNTGIPGLDGQLLLSDFPTGLIFTLDVDNDALDGGQDGLFELRPLAGNDQPVRLLELINQVRSDRGLSNATRSDLRFGINTPGEVYITNKQDGVIRRLVAVSIDGDFNGNGILDVEDINLLVSESASLANDPTYDLDANGTVDQADVTRWVIDLKRTWIGDANLDGEFSTADLTAIFQAGKFESGLDANWSEGDWTGDGRFGTSDLIAAFQDGGFEQGPRAAVASVPEPSSMVIFLLGLVGLIRLRKLQNTFFELASSV